ncbi:hypothetical protein X808_16210 [Mannheimia varigena USDA-ARS-USMARC-1296]|uniref:Uncharacterized protein n=1 Tax=Mannheimia varigena USDA-ARS-USMARC-1296 TaxID=1433287 RepID=W0QCW6_9PAST|nr:hypothetical protein X808_16210 [Mannheimia varigena USDA-ARS-USMARC-1296]
MVCVVHLIKIALFGMRALCRFSALLSCPILYKICLIF